MKDACKGRGLFPVKGQPYPDLSFFVLITLVDPLQSNYREHGEYESGEYTPAPMLSASKVNTRQCSYEA